MDFTGGGTGEQPPACEPLDIPVTDGPRGLTTIYEKPFDQPFFGGTRFLHFDEAGIVFSEYDVIYRLPLDGSERVELGPAPSETYNVADGQLLIQVSSEVDDGMVEQWLAPFYDSQSRTQIPSYVGTLWHEIDEGYVVYEVRDPENGIWAAAIPDGTPYELVPGTLPNGLLIHDGELYYQDGFSVYRVPLTGGTPTEVSNLGVLGTMQWVGSGVYWSDSTNLAHFPTGLEGQPVTIFDGDDEIDFDSFLGVEGGVYYTRGEFGCNHLYFATGPGDAELLVGGFDDADIVGATATQLFLSDPDGFYRVDR